MRRDLGIFAFFRAVLLLSLAIAPVNAAQVCTTQTVGDEEFRGISGSSDSNVIGVGKKGEIHRFDGSNWSQMASPSG
ncbi:MAG: hypothetical protein WBM76_14290, partial [Woeseiaceae bacterium]